MRLLIITQKVDREDPVLGFFHNWLSKFAEKFESIVVICLEKGKYDLPSNVKVLSLGKENGRSKVKYIFNFYRYIWQERRNYDAVFVHMNQEYVLLGWKLWRLLGKKIYFWRNHKHGNFLTRIAILFSNKVFYTSPDSFTAKFEKAVKMPVGIDVEKFKSQISNLKSEKKKNSILSLGRISPIKNIDMMLKTARILKEKGINFTLDIFGDPINAEDYQYKRRLTEENKDLIGEGIVHFYPAMPNYKTPEIYAEHEIFINLTPSGSFDKTILEAAVCGCIPIITNVSLRGGIDERLIVENPTPENVAERIEFWLKADESLKSKISGELQKFVLENHSLNALIEKLCIIIKK